MDRVGKYDSKSHRKGELKQSSYRKAINASNTIESKSRLVPFKDIFNLINAPLTYSNFD
jgi:hypothetical protein